MPVIESDNEEDYASDDADVFTLTSRRQPRRTRVGDRAPATLTNYFLNVTLQEQYERLESLPTSQ